MWDKIHTSGFRSHFAGKVTLMWRSTPQYILSLTLVRLQSARSSWIHEKTLTQFLCNIKLNCFDNRSNESSNRGCVRMNMLEQVSVQSLPVLMLLQLFQRPYDRSLETKANIVEWWMLGAYFMGGHVMRPDSTQCWMRDRKSNFTTT